MRILILFFLFTLSYSYNYEDFKHIDSEQQLTGFIQSSQLNVLVFVDKHQCNDEKDEKCRQQRSQLEQIRDLCARENLQFALTSDTQMAEKQFNIYGSLPKICFFRDGFPVIYSGSFSNLDNIQEWFTETRELLTRTLDDKSFEHDTQAASGSTTGDWFILFKNSNDSRTLLPVWEGSSLHFRNRMIFAYVNLDLNPTIQKRFHIFNLPTFILFKRGKMYRYESTSWKQTAFVEFVDSGYQHVKAEPVPAEASAFSIQFEKASKIFPMYLVVIPMICLVAVLLFLVSGFPKKKRTMTTERTPFQVKID